MWTFTRDYQVLAVRLPEQTEEHRLYRAVSLSEALSMAEREDAGKGTYTYGVLPEDFTQATEEGIAFNPADGLLV